MSSPPRRFTPGSLFVIAVLAIAVLLLLSRGCAGTLRLGDLM